MNAPASEWRARSSRSLELMYHLRNQLGWDVAHSAHKQWWKAHREVCSLRVLLAVCILASIPPAFAQDIDWQTAYANARSDGDDAATSGRYDQAAKIYSDSLPPLRAAAEADPNAAVGLAEILSQLGYAYTRTNRFKEAMQVDLEALAVSRDLLRVHWAGYAPPIDDLLRSLKALRGAGVSSEQLEQTYRETVSTFRELAETFPARYEPLEAYALDLLGDVYATAGRQEEAEATYDDAVAIVRRAAGSVPDEQSDFVMILADQGLFFQRSKKLEEAKSSFLEAETVARALTKDDPEGNAARLLSYVLGNLGNVYSSLKDFDAAERVLNESLALKRIWPSADPPASQVSMAVTLMTMANVYQRSKRPGDSEKAFQQALSILRGLDTSGSGSDQVYFSTLFNLSLLYRSQKRFDEGRALLEEALPIGRRIWQSNSARGDFLASALTNLAVYDRDTDPFHSCQLAQEAKRATTFEPFLKDALELLALSPKFANQSANSSATYTP